MLLLLPYGCFYKSTRFKVIMAILIILCFTLATFCNNVQYRILDHYRYINNGIEAHGSQRIEVEIYRGLIIIATGISIFCSGFWWAPLVGYILGIIISGFVSKERTAAIIILFGKIIKPLALLGALICTFV